MQPSFLLLLGALGCAAVRAPTTPAATAGTSRAPTPPLEGGNCERDPAIVEFAVASAQGQAAAMHVSVGRPITDEVICRRAAFAYPGRLSGGKLFDVVLVPLGNRGYMVYAREDQTVAGEFICDRATLDAQFQLMAHICG